MKKMAAGVLPALLLVAAQAGAQATAQDAVDGTVLAYDRKANVIVLTDKSVWTLEKLEGALPEELQAGDRIAIRYQANEDDGLTVIHSIERLAQ